MLRPPLAPALALADSPRVPSIRVDFATPRIAVAVVGEHPPSNADWADYVETTAALGDSAHRTIVFTAGGAPTMTQGEVLDRSTSLGDDVKLAIVHVRCGTVSRWWRSGSTRAFTPDRLDEVWGFLDLTARERAKVILLARRLARELAIAGRFAWASTLDDH